MAESTAISWCERTWSPWIGCQKVSNGPLGACEGCYAAHLMDTRLHRAEYGGPGKGVGTRERTSPAYWRKLATWNAEAEQRGRPITVFPSLCDPFDNAVDPAWRLDHFQQIRRTPHLTHLLLTKRPQLIVTQWLEVLRLDRAIRNVAGEQPSDGQLLAFYPWPRNAAIGCTVVTQAEADRDIPHLLAAKAALNPAFAFVSCEPLMGPVDLTPYLGENWKHGREQAERGICLPGRPDRGIGDSPGRDDMAARGQTRRSMERGIETDPMHASESGARRGEIPAGPPHEGRAASVRAGAPAGISPLQGADPSPSDRQSRGWAEEAEPPGQPGTRDELRPASARDPYLGHVAPSAPGGRGQQERQAFGPGSGRDQAATGRGREAAEYRGGLRNSDADRFQDRTRGPAPGLDWTIAGGETDQGAHKARPSHPDWFRSLRDQCAAAAVPFHFKQWGEWVSVSEVEGPQTGFHAFEDGACVRRVGKKAAGRTLDGVTHDAMPQAQP